MRNNQTSSFVFWAVGIFLFLIGATSRLDMPIGYRIPLSEFLVVVSMPLFVFQYNSVIYNKRFLNATFIILLWVLGVLLSDTVNNTYMPNMIRGLGKPLFSYMWFLFFLNIFPKYYKLLILYPIGVVVSTLQNFWFPQQYTSYRLISSEYDLIAYGYTPIIVASVIAIATLTFKKWKPVSLITVFIGIISLLKIGAPRSISGVLFLTFIGLFFITFQGARKFPQRLRTRRNFFKAAIVLIVSSVAFLQLYIYSAEKGLLGEGQRLKLELQEKNIFGRSFIGLILGGRTSVYASVLAIYDNPIIGYGSRSGFQLVDYYLEAVSSVGTDLRSVELATASPESTIPGHSVFFERWMENGILAAISIFLIGILITRILMRIVFYNYLYAPWFLYLGFSFYWAFFFSPFGTETRATIGLFLAFYATQQLKLSEPPTGITRDEVPGYRL